MLKSFVAIGIALIVVGAAVILIFVVPQFGADYSAALPPETAPEATGGHGFAAAMGGLALAGGAVLVGIGVGRWNRPRPSPDDGRPEV
jgi:hypothetical protein